MDPVKCPYCKHEQDINHDDGYGYEENARHCQSCSNCNKEFKFTTEISYHYDVFCSGDHVMVPFGDKWPDMYKCDNCDFYEKRI